MIGFRIIPDIERVDPALVGRYRALPSANVSDCMSRLSALGPTLRPLHGSGTVLTGPALTVRTRPGDNLMVHKAINMAEPGDVIVVDGGGDLTNALIGELMISYAATRGIAGFVINGAVRDSAWIAAQEMPVFAAGITNRGPYKDGPGEINLPIAIGGNPIAPGDLVLGDADGLVVVARQDAEAVAVAAEKKQAAEMKQLEDIAQGRNDRSWVDQALAAHGCKIV